MRPIIGQAFVSTNPEGKEFVQPIAIDLAIIIEKASGIEGFRLRPVAFITGGAVIIDEDDGVLV